MSEYTAEDAAAYEAQVAAEQAALEAYEEDLLAEAQDCDEYEDDGQPTEYEEWQDLYGGDDYDHGQFDCYDGE
jgi:hypothetical protein